MEDTMTPEMEHTQESQFSQDNFQSLLRTKLREAVRFTLMTILDEEVEAFIGAAPYQRTQQRRDQRNGSYRRDLGTGLGLIEALPVPRTRKGFRSQVFERYQRRRAELDETISDMFIGGVSTSQVGAVVEGLTGSKPSASTVSRVYQRLGDEFENWKKRPLAARYIYAFADGTYFTVIYEAEGCKMPILAVVGITEQGDREVLAFSVGERENQNAWEALLEDLKQRGVQQIDLWISDGNQAMLNAIGLKFPTSQRQRCVKHKLANVLGYIPQSQQDQVEPELKAIFYQDNRAKADQEVAAFCEKYSQIYPTAVACLKRDLEACLTFYAFPKNHWKSIRTNNIIERLFGEVKKRTHKMAAPFRNEASCLLMFYAVIRSLKFRKIAISTKQ
jgi:transposase-like protein